MQIKIRHPTVAPPQYQISHTITHILPPAFGDDLYTRSASTTYPVKTDLTQLM